MKERALSRCFTVLLVFVLAVFVSPFSASAETNGTLSTGLKWTLDDSGVLTITGNGAIPDHQWYMKNDISSVVINEGVTSIGHTSFYYCNNLTSVSIPASVSSIGILTFTSCRNLTNITVAESNSNYSSNGNCLIDKKSNCLLVGCSTSIIPSGVTSIGECAFENNVGLKSITIPGTVKSIGIGAFEGCTSLASVTIEDGLESIDTHGFTDCLALKGLTLPASVTSIGDDAFLFCTVLRHVHFLGDMLTGRKDGLDEITVIYESDAKGWDTYTGKKKLSTEFTYKVNCCGVSKTCTECGAVLPDSGSHSYTKYVSNGDATCTANGTETAKCDNGCSMTDTRTAAGSMLNHADSNNDGYCDKCKSLLKVNPAASQPAVNTLTTFAASTKAEKNSVTLKWNAVPGAVSYTVMVSPCDGGKTYTQAGVTKEAVFTVGKLKANKSYKFIIKANMADSSTIKSLTAHVAMPKYGRTNAKSLKLKFKKATLKVGKTRKIKATVTRENKKKKLLGHVAKLRYYSMNTKVATVSKAGKIKAVGKGVANIVVVTENGLSKTVKVTVK